MMAAGLFAAETDAEAAYLRSSHLMGFARLRMGKPGKLPRPSHDPAAGIPAQVLAQAEQALAVSATGSPATIRTQLAALIERYQPDELMVTGMIHDPAARIRSFEIGAEVLRELQEA